MTKTKLIEIINSLGIAVNEGITSTNNTGKNPRIVFWDYVWSDQVASGNVYEEVETIQVSFFSKTPRHEKLLELRNILRQEHEFPIISHEYIENEKRFHSYFSIDVITGEFKNEG